MENAQRLAVEENKVELALDLVLDFYVPLIRKQKQGIVVLTPVQFLCGAHGRHMASVQDLVLVVCKLVIDHYHAQNPIVRPKKNLNLENATPTYVQVLL